MSLLLKFGVIIEIVVSLQNPTLAKEFLHVSIKKKNFPAHLDLIRIEFQESKDKQKLWADLKKMLDLYIEMPRRRRILGEMVCYYLFIDYDLVEACYYMKKLIQMNSTSIDVINVSTFVHDSLVF